MSASRPQLTPSGAMSKPSTAWLKMSFFDLESFLGRGDFLAKAFTYQLYFNLVHKQDLSPWQIVEQFQPHWPLRLYLLPPVFLDYYLNDSGGYDLPKLP
jgi:hypothetical protein